MRRVLCVVVVLAVAALAGATARGVAQAQAGTLRAGIGLADLTPPVGTPMFAYTAREAVVSGVAPFLDQETFDTNFFAKTFLATVGVHTRVRARAIVLEQGGTKVALVQVDLGGLPYELHQAVVQRIESTGIDRDHLLLSATHSHGSVGPIWPLTHSGYQILGGDLLDPRVFGLVADRIAAAVLDADATLAPARAAVVRRDVLDATRNRNLGPHLRNTDEAHGGRDDDLPHSIPAELTVLRVDRADGRPLGVWSAFGIHGTSFGADMLHFTGDNQAWSERLVEDGLRARAGLGPDDLVVHAQANGAEGDVSPRGASLRLGEMPGAAPPIGGDADLDLHHPGGAFSSAELAGTRVAGAVLAAWDDAGPLLRDDLALAARFAL
nr:neutral/alkaline non-lysosomal ceramidase N-terminal domain-containing protein [Acidimicrobiia bacterium]